MKKKLIGKLSKIQSVCFALAFVGMMSACSDDETPSVNNEPTPEELAEMAAVEKFTAANSVYRALGLLNELPENWEGTNFTPEVGVPVDEANADIRNVISTGAEHAEQYFLSIVPDEGLNGNTWSHEGVGSLTYRAVNESNCYAVIDVNLTQMPGLKQLRFVPETVVGENSFSGVPYYRVGDVIKDNKKGIYWICVRPAGGPLKKDNAYFVSFDKSLIQTTTQNQNIYNEEDGELTNERNNQLTGKWVYAKNLVEERIAIAAGHTFAMFNGALRGDKAPCYQTFKRKAEKLKKDGTMDFSTLVQLDSSEGGSNSFAIAYGSYEKNKYSQVRQEKYLQPFLVVEHEDNLDPNNIQRETVTKVWRDQDNDQYAPSPYRLSLTTDYDPLSFNKLTGFWSWDEEVCYTVPYDIMNYASELFKNYQGIYVVTQPKYKHIAYYLNYYVMVMTQMSLKDHGKPSSKYELIGSQLEIEQEPDYWGSLELINRYRFEKNKNFEKVKDIYE